MMSKAVQSQDLKTVKTFCRICVGCCGLEVSSRNGVIESVLPDKTHPYNWRDFCSKGGSAHHLRDHPRRLRTPMKRVDDGYVEASYEEAIQDIAVRLNRIREKNGPHAIATYLGNPGAHNSSGHLFQNALMAGIGSNNNFYVSSVDQNNYHLVNQEMFGSELAVLIPDVDHAKCFLLIGMNPAVSMMVWIDTTPEGWKRTLEAQKNGADLIVVDPRQTATTRHANTHVQIKPGEDWAFLLGVIKTIFENAWTHDQDCADANGVEVIRDLAAQVSLASLSQRCCVSVEQIKNVAKRFATAETAVCVAHTGVAHNRNGSLGEWLSQVLNLITGRIDRKGGRFHQPGVFGNSMKMLNKLAPPVKRRSRIGNFRAIAGCYPLAILPEEIQSPGKDQIRALIINSGNPVISGPDGAGLDTALQELELLVAVDFFQRESHRHAHWLIPGAHFLEREEFYALFGMIMEKPFVQLGQAAIEPPQGVRQEWEFFCDLALEMKAPFMGLRGFNTVIRLSRWIAKRTGNPRHAFNPRWLWAFLVKFFTKIKWKDLVSHPQGIFYREHAYGHFRQQLQTPDGKIQAAPKIFVDVLKQRLAEAPVANNESFPLQLVNQRRASMMNSWLVESVKRKRVYGDYVEINPLDAARLRIEDDAAVDISSATGRIRAKACVTQDVPAGIVSMDHGWGSRLFDPAGKEPTLLSGAPRNRLISAQQRDELSGVPNLNGTWVSVSPCGVGPTAESSRAAVEVTA